MGSFLPRQRILVLTDNKSTELALNSGKSRVPFTQACLRELWLCAARYDFEISAHHIHRRLSESLGLEPSYQQQFYDTVLPLYDCITEEHCTPELYSFECLW